MTWIIQAEKEKEKLKQHPARQNQKIILKLDTDPSRSRKLPYTLLSYNYFKLDTNKVISKNCF